MRRSVTSLSSALFQLNVGAYYQPLAGKANALGEDGHAFGADFLAVADGVGGAGPVSGDFARHLVSSAQTLVQQHADKPTSPAHLLQLAVDEASEATQHRGSSTALLARVFGHMLQVAHLGDSGLMAYHEGRVVFRTTPQQHYFNCPYQAPGDRPDARADVALLPLQPGTVLVAYTDGLSDNVFDSEIDEIAIAAQRDGVQRGAELLGQKVKESVEAGRAGPWGEPKPDDTTVLVALVDYSEAALAAARASQA